MDRKAFLKRAPLLGIAGGLGFTATACSTTTGTDGGNDVTGDLEILTNAAERECVAIATYTAAAGVLETQAVLDTAIYYRGHHSEHLEIFNNLIVDLNGEPVIESDYEADPRVADVSSEEDAVLLAMSLEIDAAQSYFQDSFTNLTNNSARQAMGSIYSVEVAHFVTLKAALGQQPNITGATFVELSQDFTRF